MSRPDLALEVISLPVADQARAVRFFVELLGFELRADEEFRGPNARWITVVPPGSRISITLATWFPEMPPGSVRGMVLGVNNVGITYARFRSLQIDIDPPDLGGAVPFAAFRDSEGNHWILQERRQIPGTIPNVTTLPPEKVQAMTRAEIIEMVDAYLLKQRADRDAIFVHIAGWKPDVEAAVPIARAIALVGARAADESLIAFRIALAGRVPSNETVGTIRTMLADVARGDESALNRYRAAVA